MNILNRKIWIELYLTKLWFFSLRRSNKNNDGMDKIVQNYFYQKPLSKTLQVQCLFFSCYLIRVTDVSYHPFRRSCIFDHRIPVFSVSLFSEFVMTRSYETSISPSNHEITSSSVHITCQLWHSQIIVKNIQLRHLISSREATKDVHSRRYNSPLHFFFFIFLIDEGKTRTYQQQNWQTKGLIISLMSIQKSTVKLDSFFISLIHIFNVFMQMLETLDIGKINYIRHQGAQYLANVFRV